MGYISTADPFGQFVSACGPGCSCQTCGPRDAFNEWYVSDEDSAETPVAPPVALGSYAQTPGPTAVPGPPPAPSPDVLPGLDPHNRLAGVHPELARRIIQTATALVRRGISVTITRTGGIRTFADQAAIYAQGRTRPGRIVTHAPPGLSNHNYGLAVDLVPVVNGRPSWQVARSVWQAIGDEGKRAGLSWGGDWQTIRDYPHFELPVGLSVQQCLRIYNRGGLPAVWAEANRRLATLTR